MTNTICGPAAQLRIERNALPQEVRLDYEYSSLTNFVPVSQVSDHLKSLNEMENSMNYSLYWQNLELMGSRWFNWPVFLTALLFTAACIASLIVLYRRQYQILSSSTPPLPSNPSHLKGLGGWLILVGLNLGIGLVSHISLLVHNSKIYSFYNWQALTSAQGLRYNPAWAPLLTFELLGNLAIILLIIFSLVLFFQERRIFPQWFIIMLAANGAIVIADFIAGHFLIHTPVSPADSAKHLQQIFNVLLGAGIWIPYMCVSRRVRATFLR
jgi:hypothetical protein